MSQSEPTGPPTKKARLQEPQHAPEKPPPAWTVKKAFLDLKSAEVTAENIGGAFMECSLDASHHIISLGVMVGLRDDWLKPLRRFYKVERY